MKSSGKRKDWKKVNVLYIVDPNHQRSVIVVDHSRNFKGIQSMSKSFLAQQTVPRQCKSEVKLRNYVFTKTWKLDISDTLSEKKYKKCSGFRARMNFSEKTIYLKVVKLGSQLNETINF